MFLPTRNALKRAVAISLAGSRGGIARMKMLAALSEKQMNVNEISRLLSVDYKTAQHHIRVLEKSGLVSPSGAKYAKRWRLSTLLESNKDILAGIWEKVDKVNK